MAKSAADSSPRIVNRRAFHEYHLLEKLECGVVLQGSEVKSIRNGQVSLAEGYARVEPADMGLYLYGVDIAPYAKAAGVNAHEPKRRRKLLARKAQIAKLLGETSSKGRTLVPLAMYFSRGMVKVEVALVEGKQSHDKRQDIKTREARREIERGMTRKRL
jgi:SsrA-binding protein